MPTWVYLLIIIGIWLVVQLPIGMLVGRYLRGVRRSYPLVLPDQPRLEGLPWNSPSGRRFSFGGDPMHQGRRSIMRKVLLLSCLLTGFLTFGGIHNSTNAAPTNARPLNAIVSPSDFHLARAFVRGPRGGRAVVGPRGAFVRGPRGGRAVVGRRYYGGVWYGTGRRFWGGRWWPYGVGRCWRSTPIGFVWVCG